MARLQPEVALVVNPARSSLRQCIRRALQTSSVLALGLSAAAGAQESGTSVLEEILVTATKQTEEINRVALSVQAVTQENLDQQGIKNSADLVRSVPGLATVATPGTGAQTFSIRGIVGGTGAATTGIYLDDTNLTKRSNGGVAQNNGVVVPLLYDLARVEVLKGPQGTLYGGSSQGGTVRYITPTPSLVQFSGSGRAEASDIGQDGELSHEFAGAVGGPIIEDKLGFRLSAIRRESGGWVDTYSAYTGGLIRENANSEVEWAGRLAFLWQVTDSISAQLSGYHTDYESEGGASTTTKLYMDTDPSAFYRGVPAPQNITYTTQARCVTTVPRPTSAQVSPPPGSTAPPGAWYPTAQPGAPGASAFVPASSTAPGVCGGYLRPSRTYGPFVTGEYINLATGRQQIEGAGSESDVAAFSLNFDFDSFSIKSITSYLRDESISNAPGGEEWGSSTPPTTLINVNGVPGPAGTITGTTGQSTTMDPTHRGFPLFQDFFNATGLGHSQVFAARNKRDGFEQELRISSSTEGRLSWVGGIYYADTDTNIHYENLISPAMSDLVQSLMYGPGFTSLARYGVPNTAGNQGWLNADINDKEAAVFGEASYWVIEDTLKVIAGARYSKLELDYYQLAFGQTNGRQPLSDGSVTQGSSTDKPFTPKIGVQYQITDDKMIYATASEGFRAGGVNAEVSQTICASSGVKSSV